MATYIDSLWMPTDKLSSDGFRQAALLDAPGNVKQSPLRFTHPVGSQRHRAFAVAYSIFGPRLPARVELVEPADKVDFLNGGRLHSGRFRVCHHADPPFYNAA